jgi:predicted enzyme related to lactoylglutathione lyase
MLTACTLTVDANDPRALASWWQSVLGWEVVEDEGDEEILLRAPAADGGSPIREVLFCKVPEPKREKNRLHLDLRPDDQDIEVARVVALGARHVDVGQRDVTWVVLADPEGNEFCILRSGSADPAA